ncbi:MAG: MBOAT family O-acyltransferase, partial [Bdellovibrionota bacterium]
MIYSNPEFFVFFVAVFLAYYLVRNYTARFYILLCSSFLFYAWAGVFDTAIFVSVILVSWLSTYISVRFPRIRVGALAAGIVVLVGHLFFWKYAPWASREVQVFAPTFLGGHRLILPLPVGISFFTLQGVAYMIDLARGEAEFIDLREYSLFKAFFPQLVAGPIVRVQELLPQLRVLRTPSAEDIATGMQLFSLGLFKKLAIADRCGTFVDSVYQAPETFGRKTLLLAVLGYSVQIWADFSGYTDMGRGCARMLGIRLPENFLSPYLALSPSEFWTRWHITLSRWIRDYVYIPLGGSKGSRPRVFTVALLTMVISGLWHGANFTFLAWGVFHGALLIGERLLKLLPVRSEILGRGFRLVCDSAKWCATIFFVFVGWALFRAKSIAEFKAIIWGVIANSGTQ